MPVVEHSACEAGLRRTRLGRRSVPPPRRTFFRLLPLPGFSLSNSNLTCPGFASIPLSSVLEESLGRTPARGTVAVRSSVRCVEFNHRGSSNFSLRRELGAAMSKLELWPGVWAVVETLLEFMQQFLR